MDFLKKHYEKVILSVVLLAVIYFALRLPARIKSAREELRSFVTTVSGQATNKLQAIDLSGRSNLIKQLETPTTNQLSGPHNVFNPVPWKRGRTGEPIKVPSPDEVVRQLVVKAIRELKLRVALEEGVVGSGDSMRIKVSVTDQSLMPKVRQRPQIRQPKVVVGESNDLFKILSFRGEPANLTELVLELRKGSKQVTLSRAKAFEEVVGYEADAVFEPENKTFKEMREGTTVRFNDENYKVIAINSSDVTIEAQSTPKRYVRPLSEPVRPQ